MYESGIYNPYLNHTSCVNTLLTCSSSGIAYRSVQDVQNKQWTAFLSFPKTLLNAPSGCPESASSNTTLQPSNTDPKPAMPMPMPKPKLMPDHAYYRANFYRINELNDVSNTKCSKTDCEYLAWSPTNVDPASFHEPKRFGFLALTN